MVQPRTPLEEEVAAVLRGSAHVLERSNKELTEEEEKALFAMDLEEVQLLLYEMNLVFFLRKWSDSNKSLKSIAILIPFTYWVNSLRTKTFEYLSMLM